MKFQISAPIIWGFQFEIDDDVLLSCPKDKINDFINERTKDNLKSFFYSHNLLDIIDYISKIKHFCVPGNIYDKLINGNTNDFIYLCYHESNVAAHCC